MQPFLAGSVWREFASNTLTNFDAQGATVPVSVTRVGTFEQIGLGVAGQAIGTGLLGFVRGDYRTGTNIKGYAFNAGLRYQF